MLTILQGDDTAANAKSIRFLMPRMDVGSGWTMGLVFHGVEKTSVFASGAAMVFNYTRAQTERFPLGVSYATVFLQRNGLRETVTTTLPICVTDCVERINMASNDVNLTVKINGGVPHVAKSPLTKSSSVAEIKSLANALLGAINSTEGGGSVG